MSRTLPAADRARSERASHPRPADPRQAAYDLRGHPPLAVPVLRQDLHGGCTPTRITGAAEELRGRHKHTDRAIRVRAAVSLQTQPNPDTRKNMPSTIDGQ